MISEVIDYFKSVVEFVNPDLVYDGFVFNTLKDSSLVINDTYKLILGAMSPSRQDTTILSTMPVTIVIWQKSSFGNQEQDFINIYCEAIEMHAKAMDQSRIDQSSFIKSVTTSSISPEPLESNDNTIQMTIESEVSIIYSVS